MLADEVGAAARAAARGSTAELAALRPPRRPDPSDEARARLLAGRMARAIQGSLLVRHAPGPVADAFCATRLERRLGQRLRHAAAGVDTAAIIERHAVRV